MGDRANIIVRHEEKSFVHIYVHCAGYSLPALLHEALKKNPDDWTDPAFLTAKIAEVVMREHSLAGIASLSQDNERDVLLVDPFMRSDVTVWRARRYDEWDDTPPSDDERPRFRWTFAEYIAQEPAALVKLIHGIDY